MSNISRSSVARAGESGARSIRSDAGRIEVSALESHLGYWLRIVSNHVSHTFMTSVAQKGVTVAEWVVLRALFGQDGIKPSELADTLGLTRGAISKLIDRLIAKKFVSVRSDAHDGRAQVITLLASGRRLVPILAKLADDNDDAAFSHLNEDQRASLIATLKGIVEHAGIRGAPLD